MLGLYDHASAFLCSACILIAVLKAGGDLQTEITLDGDNLPAVENSAMRTFAVFTHMDDLDNRSRRLNFMEKLSVPHEDKFMLGQYYVVNRGFDDNALVAFQSEFPERASKWHLAP